ncbi:TPA: hypothetical protein DCL30_02130 [Candidatus Peribacteria bacterium]|nr:MAG: hypothetical protein A3J91_04140 [Candidatus Peribacteria bacterium RIFOXYC2_FULL_58_10]OGJ85232.1 MAG: hypothetical protein A2529_02085 [Candidatus Peribacteria bacterium RIFOXYD2_FULL_58_15]HAI98325.1 hypothetical protein [Candidatus Peribacteria bacterium]HAS33925.1 hypothetical protein [Candidatus Peribacteria bacterium]
MFAFVARNLLFHWRKVLVTVLLVSVVLTVGFGSMAFVEHVRSLADRPLASLGTEFVLQEDQSDKNPGAIRTQGVILPFNLQSFSREEVRSKLQSIPGVSGVSTALLLWQFDPQNNRTIVGLDVTEPPIGLRKIDSLLMSGGRFFSGNDAKEIILERHFATLFGYRVGQIFPLGDVRYPIIGLVDFHEQSNLSNAQAFLPYGTALSLVHEQGDIANRAFVSLKSAANLSTVQKAVIERFPSYSVITKDSLVKNLSALNQLLYRFGNLFVIAVAVLCVLLMILVLRLHQMEFSNHRETLRTLGWSRNAIRQWMGIEIAVILVLACVLALLFTAMLQWGMNVAMVSPPVLNTHL